LTEDRRDAFGLGSFKPATNARRSNRVVIPGEKLVIDPLALDAFPVRRDQDAMPVALAVGVFAVEFHIGLAIFGP